jgi:hypothetical protein
MNVGVAFGRAGMLFGASAILIVALIFGVYLPNKKGREEGDALIAAISSGNDKTRAAAALSSAELGDERLISPAASAFRKMKKFKGDMILAVGMLRPDHLKPENLKAAEHFLTGIIDNLALNLHEKRLAVWASGNLKIKKAVPSIGLLFTGMADISSVCVGIEAVGRIGLPSSSSKLTTALFRFNKTAVCPKTTYTDHAGRKVLLSSAGNIALKMLESVERLKDPAARDELVKMSKDESFPDFARTEAARIAASMK